MSKRENPGLYIHVPFCQTKCPYCDFYSVTSLSLVSDWLKGIQKEVSLYKSYFPPFDSLYIGGGTPTLLTESELTALIDCLFSQFTFFSDTEITIEANPDDLTREKLIRFQDLGINRISLGVQSFEEKVLRFLKRRHSVRQTEHALEMIRTSGFVNVGVDLMFGFVGQTKEGWLNTLKRALDFKPEHLSCYQMTIEEGALFGRMLKEGRIRPLGEKKERTLFLLTSRFLEDHGYTHYEISNYTREERYVSRHNCKYWHHVPYLGLGPAAHSFQEGVRWWNTRSLEHYCQNLAQGRLPVEGSERLSPEQHCLEVLYLGFRTRKGIAREFFQGQAGSDKILSELQESGLIEVDGDRVIPTREGFLVADGLPLLFSGW